MELRLANSGDPLSNFQISLVYSIITWESRNTCFHHYSVPNFRDRSQCDFSLTIIIRKSVTDLIIDGTSHNHREINLSSLITIKAFLNFVGLWIKVSLNYFILSLSQEYRLLIFIKTWSLVACDVIVEHVKLIAEFIV